MPDAAPSASREQPILLKSHFPGLNELRALAALCVIPGHLEQIKAMAGLPSYLWFPIPGKLGVILFFALSGFLITTILINEKTESCQVNLRKFYIKRALRIWPLYFLIIFLSIFALNRISFLQVPIFSSLLYQDLNTKNILLLLFILPNYTSLIIPYAAQSWSIGIEEQFYLVQPFFIKFTKSITLLIIIMLVAIFSKEILIYINNIFKSGIINKIANQSEYFGCIAIGCIGSFICHKYQEYTKKIIHSKILQFISIFTFIIFLAIIYYYNDENIINTRFHAILFTVIIINSATNPVNIFNINNKILDYFGRISYGLYMYHPLGIGCAIALAKLFNKNFQHYLVFHVALYIIALSITIGLSAVSFKYFEGFFLGFKKRLSA